MAMRMNVGQLKKMLEGVPDDARIVTPAQDHSYQEADIRVDTALLDRGCWSEDFGEAMTPEKEFGKRLPVLVVG